MLALRIAHRRAVGAASRVTLPPSSLLSFNAEAGSSKQAAFQVRTFGGVKSTTVPGKRRNAPNRLKAVRKAKEFAAAVNADGPASSSPPVDRETLPGATGAPTLADLQALKPRRDWDRTENASQREADVHARIYARTFDAVDKAFVVGQLREFAKELGLQVGSRRAKAKVIEAILASWGWSKVLPVSNVVRGTREYTVTAAELFLLQRDAAALQRINDLGVDISAAPREGEDNVFTLTGAGGADDLDELQRFLRDRKVRNIALGWPATEMRGWTPSRETLGGVARTAGAFVERVGWGQYVATGTSVTDVERARDLVLLAAARATAPTPTLAVALPSALAGHDDPRASLVPHGMTPSARPPWDVGARVAGRTLFRFVQTDALAAGIGAAERAQRSAHLDHAVVAPLGAGEASSLDEVARGVVDRAEVPAGDGGEHHTLTFRFGHLLTASDAAPGTADALHGPTRGTWPLTRDGLASGPFATLSTPIFAPAVPPALVFFPLLNPPKRERRVAYVAGDGQRLAVSYEYPRTAEPVAATTPAAEPAWFTRLDEMMKKVEAPAYAAGNEDMVFDLKALETIIDDGGGEAKPAAPAPLVLSARLETEAAADVLFPARPTDARVLGRGVRSLAVSDVPAPLAAFFDAVHAGGEAAGKVPLGDLDGLRCGVATAEAAPKLPVRQEAVDEEWTAEDDDYVPGAEVAPEEAAAPVGEPAAASTARPILPPASVELNGTTYLLASDEVAEVVESADVVGAPTLRTLSVADLRGVVGGVTLLAELEVDALPTGAGGIAVPAEVWPELANITRVVPSDAKRSGVAM
ncbi:uncharacterized protein LOC62_03G004397 [Vanrija pseudolonga]|uniref:Uncharacterized protein n=1 Tax=Vanrija pseudolonga TaxID=143232 RepID=A0AAF0Y664_9TREE|nr:hypothetical protein LOC62_03G004397 [Vanrija pseudolonga]